MALHDIDRVPADITLSGGDDEDVSFDKISLAYNEKNSFLLQVKAITVGGAYVQVSVEKTPNSTSSKLLANDNILLTVSKGQKLWINGTASDVIRIST